MNKVVWGLILATLPLSAQSWEVGAFVGSQSYDSFSGGGIEVKPERKVVSAFRAGYSFIEFGPALFQVNAAFQPKASTPVELNGADLGLKLDHQAASLGCAFVFKAGLSATVGLDFRWDRLEGSILGSGASTTYARPWLRANAGFAFPTPIVKPFVGLEVAAALVTKSPGSAGPGTDEEALKAMAPKVQIGLYAGIRF